MSETSGFPVFCSNCHTIMGYLDSEEFIFFVVGEDDPGLCFNCDADSSSTVPGIFWQWQLGDVFVIGDECILVEGFLSNGRLSDRLTHAREQAHARSCLSSSTYLNNSRIEQSQMGKEIQSFRMCRACRLAIMEVWTDGWHCPNCGVVERFPSTIHDSADSIVIPDWIIGPQIQDGDYCPDCRRINGRVVEYCDYHNDLYEGLVGVNHSRGDHD